MENRAYWKILNSVQRRLHSYDAAGRVHCNFTIGLRHESDRIPSCLFYKEFSLINKRTNKKIYALYTKRGLGLLSAQNFTICFVSVPLVAQEIQLAILFREYQRLSSNPFFNVSGQGYFCFHSPSKSLRARLVQVQPVCCWGWAEKSLDVSVQAFIFPLMWGHMKEHSQLILICEE